MEAPGSLFLLFGWDPRAAQRDQSAVETWMSAGDFACAIRSEPSNVQECVSLSAGLCALARNRG
jgi:hypothetical protein